MNGRLENDIKREKTISEKLATLPDYVAEWDLHLKASQKTTATRVNYVRQFGNFLAFVNINPKQIKLEELNQIAVQKYFVSLQTKKKNGEVTETSDSYKCATWACLNSFFTYMMKAKRIQENPILIVDKPSNHDLQRINQSRKLLTASDFKKMIRAVEMDYDIDRELMIRNKAILLLFMTTGMRKTALTEINIDDVDFMEDKITIIDKRKKTHVYPMTEQLHDALKDWLYEREIIMSNVDNPTDALFITRFQERMGGCAIMEVVKKYSKKALGYVISPHKLRAGCASILYNKTHDLEFVRRAIGHADVGTTTRYIVTQGKEREEAGNIISNLLD